MGTEAPTAEPKASRNTYVPEPMSEARRQRINRDQRIILLHHKGMTVDQVSSEIGCHATTVTKVLNRNGIYLPRVTHVRIDPRVNLIAAKLQSGETLEAIGKVFGLTRERVRQLAAKAGIRSTRQQDERRIRVVSLLRAGETCQSVSGALGLSIETIRRIARQAGLDAKSEPPVLPRPCHASTLDVLARLLDGTSPTVIAREMRISIHGVNMLASRARNAGIRVPYQTDHAEMVSAIRQQA